MLAVLRFNVSVNTVIGGYLTLLSYEELRDFLNLLVNLGVEDVNFIGLYTPKSPSLKPSYKELLRFSTFMNNLKCKISLHYAIQGGHLITKDNNKR